MAEDTKSWINLQRHIQYLKHMYNLPRRERKGTQAKLNNKAWERQGNKSYGGRKMTGEKA